jgi:IclR family transcriptional regulator, KDG regulon repressor
MKNVNAVSYTVDAVAKALQLLFLIASRPGLGVTQLSKQTGITKARTFRLLETMEKCGLIQRQSGAALYKLSYMAHHLSISANEQLLLLRKGRRHAVAIASELGERVLIRVRDGLETICVAQSDTAISAPVNLQVGSRRPLYAGASGKLLLALASADVRMDVLASHRLRFTTRTPTERDVLEQELTSIRERRYSVSYSEFALDRVAVAVPIVDALGRPVAALSVSAVASRISDDGIHRFVEVLSQHARELSHDLGYLDDYFE